MSKLRSSLSRYRRVRGFTIIELVITLAIVALLATAVLPSAQLMYQRERESQLQDALRIVRGGIDAYKKASDTGHIKKIWTNLAIPDLQDVGGRRRRCAQPQGRTKIYFLRAIPTRPVVARCHDAGGRDVGTAILRKSTRCPGGG
jgi:general secretion pathway protein G